MDDFVLIAGGMKLAYAGVAVTGLVFLSRWLDQRAGKSFKEVIDRIAGNNLSAAIYYGLRFIALAIVVGMMMGCAPANAGPVFTSKYDRDIRAAVDRWWPDYPRWTAWKAQLYQESRLDPAAVSPVGAAGLAQFMPATWSDITRELRLGSVSPHAGIAIDAGAYYMRKLRAAWSAPRPSSDRQQLAQASYNAGMGNILEAQRRCNGPPLYRDIIACLPAVTGIHARETLTYVDRIAKWQAMMEAGG